MTVTGNVTAIKAATSYVPPFKYVTSYAPAPVITGTVTGTAQGTGTTNTGVPTASSDSGYAQNYLDAHLMSSPSYRYAYLLWIVLAFLILLYTISHHLRLSGTSLGATYTKWGMKRRTVGARRLSKSLPANSALLSMAIIIIPTVLLCILGQDYIAPSDGVFSFRKRSGPTYSIGKSFWTSGSRFGDLAFALTPFVVLVALKSAPFGFLSFRGLTHLYFDKLAAIHRMAAWLLWALTTVHVVLWTVQLFQDQYNGKPVWLVMFTNYRFIFGVVAYGAMTAVMLFSLRPIRKGRYEFFYIAHVVFVLLTLVCSAIHHPPLWYWMAAALILWIGERVYRFLRMSRINAIGGKKGVAPLESGRPYSDIATGAQEYGMNEIKSPRNYTDKSLPRPPGAATPDSTFPEFGTRLETNYYDDGSLQPMGTYDSRYSADATYSGTRHKTSSLVYNDEYFPVDAHEINHRNKESIATQPASTPFVPAPIPVGFALAQLLPSRVVRLTIKVAKPFKWAPGQSVLLYLPTLSKTQSHPFTILNSDSQPKSQSEIVLLVKARKGLTRKLFNLVRTKSLATVGLNGARDKRLSLASMRTGAGGVHVPPVYLKAMVDGPMGSAGRVRWGDYSTVVIICGGSGVSFGAAVCEHVCNSMVKLAAGGRTKRVRFCWVAREYAEISWVAHQLRRCQELLNVTQLQIDIFVTKANNRVREEFAPPKPTFAQGGDSRRGSYDSVMSEMSAVDSADDHETLETHGSGDYADVIDLTNYEDEEDVNDPAENHLSNQLQQQGKIRRAKSRKATKGRSTHMAKSPSYPPTRHPLSMYEDPDVVDPYATPGPGSRAEYARPQASALLNVDPETRASSRSLADSHYGRYDPFNGGAGSSTPFRGASPSPSMFFDDAQSIAGESVRGLIPKSARTQSMVLLEDNGTDPSGDAALWIDEADHSAMLVMCEMARPGKPKLARLLEEEIEEAQGSLIVATCGPVALNTVVRNLVAAHIAPGRIRNGDRRGHIAIYSEDYES
ncbi:hypothetical protein P7C73_g496, partial [Tremellales sp. Uapishka_1]